MTHPMYDKTEVLEVFIWSCMECGKTSLPIVMPTYGSADDAVRKHWDAEHAVRA